MKSDPITSNLKRLFTRLRLAAAAMLVFAAGAMALSAASSSADNPAPKSKNGVYIVKMRQAPAVVYKGEIAGYKATAPKKGQKIDPLAPDTVRYVGYLKAQHS